MSSGIVGAHPCRFFPVLQPNFTGQLEFNGIHFIYPTRLESLVLRNFKLKVEPGNAVLPFFLLRSNPRLCSCRVTGQQVAFVGKFSSVHSHLHGSLSSTGASFRYVGLWQIDYHSIDRTILRSQRRRSGEETLDVHILHSHSLRR